MKTLKTHFISAYLQLLQQYFPNQITVKQIVTVANTSRSSFYLHFESREQLHIYLKEIIQKEFLTYYDHRLGVITNETNANSTTLGLCKHMVTYRAYYKHALQDAIEIQYMSEQLSSYLQQVYEDKDYAIFASYGTIGYLKSWVEEDFIISPSEAAEKLTKIGFTNWSSKVIR